MYPYGQPAGPPPPRKSHWVAWLIGGIVAVVAFGALIVGLVVTLVAPALNDVITNAPVNGPSDTATSAQTFSVSDTPSLVVFDAAGDVTVRTGASGQIGVEVTKFVTGPSDAVVQSGLTNTVVDLSQSGNTVSVSARAPTRWFDGGVAERSVDLVITVPASTQLDVHVGAGVIDVQGVTGVVKLDTGAGNITASGVTLADGSLINAEVGNATVDGALVPGASLDVEVHTGNATLTLPANTPAHLDAVASLGSITITGWPITVSTHASARQDAAGDLGTNPTGTVTVHVATGNIVLNAR
jgi:Toastrack DUF4097